MDKLEIGRCVTDLEQVLEFESSTNINAVTKLRKIHNGLFVSLELFAKLWLVWRLY